MKKILALILCVVLVLSFAGCSKNSGETNSSATVSITTSISKQENKTAESEAKSSGGSKPVLLSAFTQFENGKPQFTWKNIKGREGFSVTVILTDEKGKVVEKKEGITEDSYTITENLTLGQKYTAEFYYVTPSGNKGIFGGINKTAVSYTHYASNGEYDFDYAIPFDVLNNYLSKAITYDIYAEGDSVNGRFNKVMAADAKRAILNVGAKHIARTLACWLPSATEESAYPEIKEWITDMHNSDPDIIFEACIFETCGKGMNTIKIPDWVFKAFGKKVEDRNFDFEKMMHSDGYGKDNWSTGSHIPDISKEETQMFFYYRACNYIDMGIESLHMGQMNLIGKGTVALLGDKAGSSEAWTKVITMIREYAAKNARRHYVLINGHYPDQNLKSSTDGSMLVDFNAFILTMKPESGEKDHAVSENNPQKNVLVQRSDLNTSGISPSGWYNKEYPYLLEFDNYGGLVGDNTKMANNWGYDQISWIANQPDSYRRDFLKHAYETIEGFNSVSHVTLIGRRTSYVLKKGKQDYYVMNDAAHYADGFSDEATIKEIFSK